MLSNIKYLFCQTWTSERQEIEKRSIKSFKSPTHQLSHLKNLLSVCKVYSLKKRLGASKTGNVYFLSRRTLVLKIKFTTVETARYFVYFRCVGVCLCVFFFAVQPAHEKLENAGKRPQLRNSKFYMHACLWQKLINWSKPNSICQASCER